MSHDVVDRRAGVRPSRSRSWRDRVGLVARLVLGCVLLGAGVSKIGALSTSAAAVRAFKILPFEVANMVGYLLPVIELALGVLLVLGLFTRVAAAVGGLLMLVFTIGIISVWARGISIDCGCFGGGGALDQATAAARYPWDVARDVGLFMCALWLLVRPRTPFGLDRWLHAGRPTH